MTTTVTEDLLATLDARYKVLKAEMQEVKRLRAAIKAASSEPMSATRKRLRSAEDGPTFKDMIKAVLTEKGEGAEALEIIELIKAKFGKEIKRTSISPQLSRLKAGGELVLEDKFWMLPNQAMPRNVTKVTGVGFGVMMPGLDFDLPHYGGLRPEKKEKT